MGIQNEASFIRWVAFRNIVFQSCFRLGFGVDFWRVLEQRSSDRYRRAVRLWVVRGLHKQTFLVPFWIHFDSIWDHGWRFSIFVVLVFFRVLSKRADREA